MRKGIDVSEIVVSFHVTFRHNFLLRVHTSGVEEGKDQHSAWPQCQGAEKVPLSWRQGSS